MKEKKDKSPQSQKDVILSIFFSTDCRQIFTNGTICWNNLVTLSWQRKWPRKSSICLCKLHYAHNRRGHGGWSGWAVRKGSLRKRLLLGVEKGCGMQSKDQGSREGGPGLTPRRLLTGLLCPQQEGAWETWLRWELS